MQMLLIKCIKLKHISIPSTINSAEECVTKLSSNEQRLKQLNTIFSV